MVTEEAKMLLSTFDPGTLGSAAILRLDPVAYDDQTAHTKACPTMLPYERLLPAIKEPESQS